MELYTEISISIEKCVSGGKSYDALQLLLTDIRLITYQSLTQLQITKQESKERVRLSNSETKTLYFYCFYLILKQRKFLLSLTKEVADDANNESVRMLSAILIKNLITNKTKVSLRRLTFLQDSRFENFWVNLAGTDKDTIKTALLAVLAMPSANVRRQVAIDIASIAAIEIPRKEFLDLIPNLNANSSSSQMDVKLASLETLSRVCEEIDASDLTTELKNLVVTALVTNFKTEPEFTKAT